MERNSFLPMSSPFLLILLVIAVLISVSQLGVIFFFINFIKKNELHDGAIKDAQEKSAAVITQAVTKANEVVAEAEKAQMKKVEESASMISELSKQFEEKIEKVEETATSSLTQAAQSAETNLTQSAKSAETKMEEAAKTAQTSYTEMINQSQTAMGKMMQDDKQVLESKMNEMIGQSNQMFQQFMAQLGNQMKAQLSGELAKAKTEVEEYKKERVATMNEKIIDILEEVLLTTLAKKLSLKDEGEFVFEALETAKKEHAFDTT